jgi:iron-sulfur cluster insertion protein
MSELVIVTESAAKRVAFLVNQEGTPDAALRVAVNGGGCSGFQYGFSLDETRNDDDLVIEKEGATVLVDMMSQLYLAGSEIDFVEDVIGSVFQIRNPNAKSECGCGTSFSV